MSKPVKLPEDIAIQTWNKLALNNTSQLTIAHNPALFGFYTGYLKMPAYYFILHKDGQPVGLLPLVRTGKKKYLSLPHFSYGGILWKKETNSTKNDDEIISQLVSMIEQSRLPSGFYRFDLRDEVEPLANPGTRIEIRGLKPLFTDQSPSKVLHTLPVPTSSESFKKALDGNLRRKVNKSYKNNLKLKTGNLDLVDDFSRVYNRNMHEIGSPTLGSGFFKALIGTKRLDAHIFVVYRKGLPIGGALVMWYDGYYENTWFSTLREYNNLYPSYMLHWEMIKHAGSVGATTYSMGRSSIGSGVHSYKSQWPAREQEIYFSLNHPSGVGLKDQKWLTKVWKRMPKAIVDNLGPPIAKKIY